MVGEIRDAETAHIAIHAALDRPSRADHAAHRDRGRGGAAPDRSRRRGLPAEIDAARRDRRSGWCACCATAARCRNELTAADLADDPRYARARASRSARRSTRPAAASAAAAPAIAAATACSRSWKCPSEVRNLIGPQTDSRLIDQPRDARRHDHDDGGCGREMPRRRHHGGRGPPRHDGAVNICRIFAIAP